MVDAITVEFTVIVLVVIESPIIFVKFICDVDIFVVDIFVVDNDNTVSVDCKVIVFAFIVLPNIVTKLIGPDAVIVDAFRVEFTVI